MEQLSRLSIIHRLLNQSKFPLSKSKLLESSADIEYPSFIALPEASVRDIMRFQPNVTVISPAVLKESVEQCVLKAVQKIAQGQYVTLLFSKMNRLIIQG